jgi:hypothetical protein
MSRIRQLLLTAVTMTVPAGLLPVVAQDAPQGFPGAGPTGSPNQQVAMIMLQVSHDKGRTYITTPKGYRAEVPGKGVPSNAKAVAIYQDPQQNFWYINKHGEPTEVKPEVVRSAMMQFQGEVQQNHMNGQSMQQGGMPPGAMAGNGTAPVQQTTIVQQPATGGGGGGAGAMMGAASMAMSGTALGMSIGAMANSGHNNYYGVPYGKPIYQDNHHYYYNNDSKKVFVNPNANTKAAFNQFDHQGNWANRENWAHNGVGGRRFRR